MTEVLAISERLEDLAFDVPAPSSLPSATSIQIADLVQGGIARPEYRLVCSRLFNEAGKYASLFPNEVTTGGLAMDVCSVTSSPIAVDGDTVDSFVESMNWSLVAYGDSPFGEKPLDREWFDIVANRIRLLEFLIGEVQASRTCSRAHIKSGGSSGVGGTDSSTVDALSTVQLSTSMPSAEALIAKCCGILNVPVSGDGAQALQQVTKAVRDILTSLPRDHLGAGGGKKIVDVAALDETQLAKVEEVNAALRDEYANRRLVLVKRLKVTLMSFVWGGLGKQKEEELGIKIEALLQTMAAPSYITVYDASIATDDVMVVYKTNSRQLGDRPAAFSSVKKMVIGTVPDRGGRTSQEEGGGSMPAFTERTTGTPQPQRDRGKGRRGRGGKKGGGRGGGSGGGGGDGDGGDGGGGGSGRGRKSGHTGRGGRKRGRRGV